MTEPGKGHEPADGVGGLPGNGDGPGHLQGDVQKYHLWTVEALRQADLSTCCFSWFVKLFVKLVGQSAIKAGCS